MQPSKHDDFKIPDPYFILAYQQYFVAQDGAHCFLTFSHKHMCSSVFVKWKVHKRTPNGNMASHILLASANHVNENQGFPEHEKLQ